MKKKDFIIFRIEGKDLFIKETHGTATTEKEISRLKNSVTQIRINVAHCVKYE